MIRLGLEQPPASFTNEQSEYLTRVISQLIDSINSVHDMDHESKYPANQEDGQFRFSIGDGDFQDGAGFYGRVGGVWGLMGGNTFNPYGGISFEEVDAADPADPDSNSIFFANLFGHKTWFGRTTDNDYRVLGFDYVASPNIGIVPKFDQIQLNRASNFLLSDGVISYAVDAGTPYLLLRSGADWYTLDITKVV